MRNIHPIKRMGCPTKSVHGPATGRALRDFAGSEERGRGGRAALSELANASEFAALP